MEYIFFKKVFFYDIYNVSVQTLDIKDYKQYLLSFVLPPCVTLRGPPQYSEAGSQNGLETFGWYN